ncbi:MAG: aspartyl protease family protein [Bacteroidales bacterium]|nr:aspartyl protease family protein [Bacteroidales bacterium]
MPLSGRQHTPLLGILILWITASLYFSSDNVTNGTTRPGNCAGSCFPQRDPEPLGDFLSLRIPLKKAGNLVLIEACIDTLTGNLILDTGASGLVLNSTYFRTGYTVDRLEYGGVTGSSGAVRRTRIDRLQIYDLYYENVTADLSELGHIENRRGVRILGLLGLNMLQDMEMMIDVANSLLVLYRLDKNGNRLHTDSCNTGTKLEADISLMHDVMFMKASIGGKTLNFCLDTGAEMTLIDHNLPQVVFDHIVIRGRSTLRGVGGGHAEVLYGALDGLMVGETDIGSLPVLVSDLSGMGQAYGISIDGMLGYDFFASGAFCINLVRKSMVLYLPDKLKTQ